MYLLDSDTLIFALRGNTKVADNFELHAVEPKAISVISYGELLYGANLSARSVENSAKVRRLSELFPLIDVSPAIMETFSSLKVKLRKKGKKIDEFDLIIASTAINLNYTLVTNNTRHFSLIPSLETVNWSK